MTKIFLPAFTILFSAVASGSYFLNSLKIAYSIKEALEYRKFTVDESKNETKVTIGDTETTCAALLRSPFTLESTEAYKYARKECVKEKTLENLAKDLGLEVLTTETTETTGKDAFKDDQIWNYKLFESSLDDIDEKLKGGTVQSLDNRSYIDEAEEDWKKDWSSLDNSSSYKSSNMSKDSRKTKKKNYIDKLKTYFENNKDEQKNNRLDAFSSEKEKEDYKNNVAEIFVRYDEIKELKEDCGKLKNKKHKEIKIDKYDETLYVFIKYCTKLKEPATK